MNATTGLGIVLDSFQI